MAGRVTTGAIPCEKKWTPCRLVTYDLIVLKNMSNFVVDTVTADCLAPSGAMASPGTVMIKFVSRNIMTIIATISAATSCQHQSCQNGDLLSSVMGPLSICRIVTWKISDWSEKRQNDNKHSKKNKSYNGANFFVNGGTRGCRKDTNGCQWAYEFSYLLTTELHLWSYCWIITD